MDTKDRMDGCVCANGAKVTEILHPYCPAHVPPEMEAELASLRAEIVNVRAMFDVTRARVAKAGGFDATLGWLHQESEVASLRAEVERLTRERDSRPAIHTLPTELTCGEWIMSGQAEPDAVVTYASKPSPETGHIGWCWWARGTMGEARDYMAAREAAERSIRAHAARAGVLRG